ncbi:hypothetical protein LTR13_007833 [Exophiala sideris]|nr:hypothetical protein LTR13_007833 [Exophiala sideris]
MSSALYVETVRFPAPAREGVAGMRVSIVPEKEASDRISISKLLDSGTDSFTEPCNFPVCREQTSEVVGHEQTSEVLGNEQTLPAQAPAPSFIGYDDVASIPWDAACMPPTLAFFDDGDLPFPTLANYPTQSEELPFLDIGIPDGLDYDLSICADSMGTDELGNREADPSYVRRLQQYLLEQTNSLQMDKKRREAIIADINFLVTPVRTAKFINLYFDNWHVNGPILHRPSFSPEHVQTSLLLAVTVFGAMYSNDVREHRIASSLLGIAEILVFSTAPFSWTAPIQRWISDSQTAVSSPEDEWADFEHLQAAYLVCSILYWAGLVPGRYRVLEIHLSHLIRVARRLGLLKVQHTLKDRISEELWIRQESQIRRDTGASELFEMFFQDDEDHVANAQPWVTTAGASVTLDGTRRSGSHILTLMDLYVFAHLLCIMIHTRAALLSPFRAAQSAFFEAAPGPSGEWNALIDRALARWSSFWEILHANTSPTRWAATGMYKNSYNIWRVARLLHDKKESVGLLRSLEVPCPDKVAALKVLLGRDE